jgi:diaminopimelate epimerase
MRIPFTKAHGAHNDFLLTWRDQAPTPTPAIARAICERHTGIGADGWMLVERGDGETCDGAIHLFNSDGSDAEISGNGTRCAAALLVEQGYAGQEVRIRTGAGIKHLRLIDRRDSLFTFEMNMGTPEIRELRFDLPLAGGARDVTLVWVGNPQCAVPVDDFDFDWRAMGEEIEKHPQFPARTNVSFIRRIDTHTIDVRFYERGAGETMSSGTGSTGAAAAALARGLVTSPIRVLTPAGALDLRADGVIRLTGPAEIVAAGEFRMGE